MNKGKYRSIAWIIISLMVVIGIAYPLFTPYNAGDYSFPASLHPTAVHLLGTDEMGHDLFSQLLAGFRVTIGIALSAAFLATLLGTVLAVLGAYYQGLVYAIITRLSELFLIVPEIVVLLFFAAIAQPRVYNSVLAIAFFSWSKVTRILQARAALAVNSEKVQYTLLLKGGLVDTLRKIWGDIYPAVSTLFIFQVSKATVYESTLAFFGIGDPLAVSWGRIIRMALDYPGVFRDGVYIWYLLPPIICISVFVVILSMLAFESE